MNKTLKKSLVMVFSVFMVIATVMSCGCIGGNTEPSANLNSANTNNELNQSKGVETTKNSEFITVTDMAGRTIQVPTKINKIIGLGCSLREIVYLDSEDKVIAIEMRESVKAKSDDDKFPCGTELPYLAANPELIDLPIAGKAGANYNYEAILKMNPDVIFIGNNKDAAEDLQSKLNIPVVVVYTAAIGSEGQNKKYEDSLKLMGKILDKEERANEVLDKMEEYKEDLKSRVSKATVHPTAYVAGRAYNGAHGITTTDPRWPPFEFLGANNIAYNVSKISEGKEVSKEQVVSWNPEYIFVSEASMNEVTADLVKPEFQGLNAVKNGKVYKVLPYCWYAFNKDTAIANAYYVGKVLYPEQFADIDPEEKADEIYMFFDGNVAYEEIANRMGGYGKLEA
ncbi:ABC transporter substrate-binding protein [Methanococcus voltae]|uniref:Iron complex transport system substrate-binding protein n=1 Tax=Methanococcus voltae TaxID=2188 RepID=A0A8J7RIG7_METVO|nr:ABC transporter substrate-binding protein [Methanococcus voltae]MBP2173148.1 iron complex transport system substrate-binding protein [Methanococcus voltae]MBP2202060.1 iron complex transport system substrate-binding protein [Methanococcus voltae]